MKKHLFFALILFIAMPSMAQVAKVRPHHGGNHHGNSTLTITAPRGLSFWLFVDDVLQNEEPVRSICIRNLWDDSFYIRVELNNQLQNCVGQFVDLRQSQSLVIAQSSKFFGLEPTQAHVRPELTMDLVIEQAHAVPDGSGAIPSAPPMPFGMNPKDYEDAYELISKETFDSSKLSVAKQVASSNPMTADQILNICKLFSFESNKLEFAKFAYDNCTEKNKYYLLNEAFSYNSTKRELDEFIKSQQ